MLKGSYACMECGTEVAVYGACQTDVDAAIDNRRRLRWPCRACLSLAAKAKSAAAVQAARDLGWDDLLGTEREIARASRIRLSVVPLLEGVTASILDRSRTLPLATNGAARGDVAASLALFASNLRDKTDAAWWIATFPYGGNRDELMRHYLATSADSDSTAGPPSPQPTMRPAKPPRQVKLRELAAGPAGDDQVKRARQLCDGDIHATAQLEQLLEARPTRGQMVTWLETLRAAQAASKASA